MKCISNSYGDKRDRTADPLLARQVLSQLSYIPSLNIFLSNSALYALFFSHLHQGKLLSELRQAILIYTKIIFKIFIIYFYTSNIIRLKTMGRDRLELSTSRLSGVRSNRLSYKPMSRLVLSLKPLVEISGIEPLTPCLQSRCSPSWAIPPYLFQGYSFLRPWKLNNDFLVELRNAWPWMLELSISKAHVSIERRWSSRTFRYGYLVTTSPQSPILPSAASSLRLDYWLRVLPAPMVWRAVCTRPGNVFTAACWSAITSNSDFIQASCSLQSELGPFLGVCSASLLCFPLLMAIVVRV